MVICLRCGSPCCTEIWPGNHNDELEIPEPCPQLETREDGLCSCKIYSNRPKRCRDEHMGVGEEEYCPIGLLALEAGKVPQPTGKCLNCGGLTYDGLQFCGDFCEKATINDLNAFIKRGCKEEGDY